MAMPIRRSSLRFGAEAWAARTWCSEISPGCSGIATASSSFTSTAISWPRVSRFSLARVSRCSIWFQCWLPGITFMHPLSSVAGDSASQAVTTSGLSRPQ